MAVARKVIVFDYKEISAQYVYATGVRVLALSIAYWLGELRSPAGKPHEEAF